MSKKTIILTLSVVLILSAGVFFWRTQHGQMPNTNEPVPVVKTDIPEQKNVRVSDGTVEFSFEVPKDWFVETRNDGEKPMTESGLREFLATSYQNDPKASPDSIESDYAYLTWNQLQKMTLDDMKSYMIQREKEVGVYPNASVASSDSIIGYRGPTRQIDFYFLTMTEAQQAIANEKALELTELKQYSKDIAEKLRTQWTSASIDEKNVLIANYQLEVLENGERVNGASMGRPGGKKYYIFFPEMKKALLIDKQSLGDEESEAGFQQVVQTLRFSK